MADTAFTDGVTQSAAAWANDVNSMTYGYLTSVAGTNTVTATGPQSLSSYSTVNRFVVVPAATNTGATTINVSSLGAKNVYARGASCTGGELVSGVPALLQYDGTRFHILNPTKPPTRQTFLSGSGTYTTPAGVTQINIRMVGGGGGGGATTTNSGTSGTASTFGGSLSAGGGSGAGATGGSVAGGGTASGGDINIGGSSGGGGFTNSVANVSPPGADGGNSVFGGGGKGATNTAGSDAATNSGSGGGGGGGSSGTGAGGGGGAGGYVEKLITSPSATYTYTVGAAGTGGAAGGNAGGNGAAGIIIVDEYYT